MDGLPTMRSSGVGGMVTAMAKVIKYYVPDRFKKPAKWIPSNRRGKLIEFPVPEKKSA